MKKINMKNIGPIKSLSIDPIEGGGIVVFVGDQGSGKSTALAAVTKRLSGQSSSVDLSPRDGTERGELWIGQAKLTITRGRQVNKGELEVQHIEGRFDISKLCDPGIKDPVAADQARIKALIALSGATANPSDFYDACGGQEAFDELGVDCDATDPIVLAGRTSRALHATARKAEKKATGEFAAAKAKRDEAGKVDMSHQSDGVVLHSAWDGANRLVTELDTKQLQYTEQRAAVAKAGESLDQATVSGPSQADAAKSLVDQQHSLNSTLKEIDKARADLARAEAELELRQASIEHAQGILNTAIAHDEMVKGLKEVIASAQLQPVADDTLAAAQKARADAYEAAERGVLVRQAKIVVGEAESHEIWAIESQERAEILRKQSRDVDAILSRLIPAGNLRIDEGRIVTKTDRSNAELFSELSDGERAALAIEIAVPKLPEDGLLIAPQWMWEGWTESTQKTVWAKLKAHGVMMLTAEARDGELAVEVFEGSHE